MEYFFISIESKQICKNIEFLISIVKIKNPYQDQPVGARPRKELFIITLLLYYPDENQN